MGSHTQHKSLHPILTPASKPVFDLPTLEGWKAEFTQATRQCNSQESNSQLFDPDYNTDLHDIGNCSLL